MRKRPVWIVIAALTATVIVVAATLAQSVTEHSLEPMWTVGWIPAALIASLARPRTARRCRRRRSRP